MTEPTVDIANALVPDVLDEVQGMFELSEPQPRYGRMIEQGGFVKAGEGFAMVFSRDLADFVLRHHELFSSKAPMDLGNVRPLIPLNVDPPEHSKYRKLLDPLFAPKQMEAQEDDITARANHFIDSFVDRGECNFSEEYAELFPSAVFLGLMGLPWDELDTFLRLRDGILRPERTDPDARFDVEKRQVVQHAIGQEVYDYFNAALDERERHPTDDILTHFITAEVDGDKLSREDILDICFLFLIAGLDTVSDTLTCSYAFLATHPEHRQQLVDDPVLVPNAVEELLRWESPVPGGVPRIATEDTELPNGEKIAAGTAIMVSYGGANVDPSEFPDAFDVRFDRAVNRHIAFGGGVHRCLGSHLARRELRVTLREWHRRIPDYHIKPGHEELVYTPGLRYVENLTLQW
ncbi:MAG TPA: cytochrome P450 [Acidimicrobiia bacterium]|nr:cytochrome P450 [Acidimicrobiia bacterium]